MKSFNHNTINTGILKERVEKYGVDTLMDAELISILTGIPLEQATNITTRYSLAELIRYTSSIDITKSQRRKLELLYQFLKRVNTSEYREKQLLNSSSTAGQFFVNEMQFLTYEVFNIALLNSQNRLIRLETVSKGTINEAPVYPREIVRLAISLNASSLILAHNHPGGSKEPSAADIEVTRKITQALKTISVSVIDHIIVAENCFTSFAERGLLSVAV